MRRSDPRGSPLRAPAWIEPAAWLYLACVCVWLLLGVLPTLASSVPPVRDEIARLAADEVRRFGIVPKVALVSHSSFGSSNDPQARKMQVALALINAQEPELGVEGEMQGDGGR